MAKAVRSKKKPAKKVAKKATKRATKNVRVEDDEYSQLLQDSLKLIEKVSDENVNKVRMRDKLKTTFSNAENVDRMLIMKEQLKTLHKRIKRMSNG